MNQPQELNLASPTFKANPYPVFTELRAHDPLHKITLQNGRSAWLVTRYQDAEKLLRDERFVKSMRNSLTPEEIAQQQSLFSQQSSFNFLSQHMLNADPPDHTRLRSLINLSFTPRLVEQWRSRIQALTDELLDAIENKGEMDLIDQFAFPLPMMVISEMLGVPDADRSKFRSWSNLVVEAAGNPEAFRQAADQLLAFYQYMVQLIEDKRQTPADDLLSKLILAEAEGNKLSQQELVSMIFLLIIAGHETTVNLISNGVLALLEHPEQFQLLKEQPELIKTAIEEFLRYRGPLMLATQRWAREDAEYEGKHIQRGDHILIALSAANRDDEEFGAADKLDITRRENRHLAFGKGIHYCLGAPLARLEGQIAIGTLVRRFPDLRLNADPQTLTWRPGSLIMGLNTLPVSF
ncbi:cytochrome P450 family protein [Ktedonospora formicarum]|uniref:Cytochrome P450 n=1 Tax=Ktedonospora formicarum TaxID=2778364 RepID=A0A8J3MRG1_9CHLR|nr:cytochrome P450 [Ktedonospora formicarum]GHO46002.1 cytochrome P450 [Ktedonospora formicarum]